MSDDQQLLSRRLEAIFMPYATEKRKSLVDTRGRFVHYTTAENALSILRSRQIWLRNARCMHDFSEVHHGYNRLNKFFSDPRQRDAFLSAINKCSANAADDALQMFDQWWMHIQTSTYLSCLSEHDDREDQYGRLSMWRAYGRSSPAVAVVLKLPIENPIDNLNVFLSPVAYLEDSEFATEMARVIKSIEDNQAFLGTLDRGRLIGMVYNTLVMAAVSLKHPAFREEREWRAIHLPLQYTSPSVSQHIETVAGVPQNVCKLELRDRAQDDIVGIEFSTMFDRLIIGPSAFPFPMFSAFVTELEKAGIQNAHTKVHISDIPIRT
jgi:hypothetical protein